ncbi:terpene synthase family protein [Streptomyces olivoreticuli]
MTNIPVFPVEIRLPSLVKHLPFRVHPESEEIVAESAKWVREHMLHLTRAGQEMDDLLEERRSLWPCFYLADAPTYRVLVVSNFCFWITEADFDDEIKDSPVAVNALADAVLPAYSGAPIESLRMFVRPLGILMQEIRKEAPEAVVARLREGGSEFIRSVSDHLHMAALDRPTLDDYLTMREIGIGMTPFYPMIEYALGVNVGEEIPAQIKRIHNSVSRWQTIHNDILSMRREVAQGSNLNAVIILARQENCSIQESVDELCRRLNLEEERFVHLCGKYLLRNPYSDHHIYLRALGETITATWQWSFSSSRYNGRGHQWNGAEPRRVAMYSDRAELFPE